MFPSRFRYEAPHSLDEAIALLREGGDDAKVLAGGHSLLPMMKLRLATPEVLIDIARAKDLAGIRVDGDALVIGATTRHAELATSEQIRADAPLLAHAASLVGDPQIRHRGTIGGSLAHADPAADLPMALVALGGSVELTGTGGTRTVSADDFFTGFFETALEDGELLTAVRVPRRPGVPWGYQKFVRRANDWAIVGAAAVAGRIALANMGPVPVRARAAEDALAGGASVADAAGLAAQGTSPGEDIHADRAYREHLSRVLTRRALEHLSYRSAGTQAPMFPWLAENVLASRHGPEVPGLRWAAH
jgi:carbon-monoxide dehydrogenase medium subunit